MADYKDKRVLIFGLGLLGGGVATANWFIKKGARVTITDLKDEYHLADSINGLEGDAELKLGGHDFKYIDDCDVVVVNPDVSIKNKFIQYALEKDKEVTNEAVIFYEQYHGEIIGVTGTRGKTTTVAWINHILNSHFESDIAGNLKAKPFLKMIDGSSATMITEMPSYQLELFEFSKVAPKIAVVTNIYQDHLNRYESIADYAKTKANLFKWQNSAHILILNADNDWTGFMLDQKPKARIYKFSTKKLNVSDFGIYYDMGNIYFQNINDSASLAIPNFVGDYGKHNLENLLIAVLVAKLKGCPDEDIKQRINDLPEIEFRQQTIYKDEKLRVINDTTATSPEGSLAALRRFSGPNTILITGGTDRNLDYVAWAKELPQLIRPENVIFISGSATDKMLKELANDINASRIYDTLGNCIDSALKKSVLLGNSIILFSPAAKSFEKFKNEYDRGEQFNKLISEKLNNE